MNILIKRLFSYNSLFLSIVSVFSMHQACADNYNFALHNSIPMDIRVGYIWDGSVGKTVDSSYPAGANYTGFAPSDMISFRDVSAVQSAVQAAVAANCQAKANGNPYTFNVTSTNANYLNETWTQFNSGSQTQQDIVNATCTVSPPNQSPTTYNLGGTVEVAYFCPTGDQAGANSLQTFANYACVTQTVIDPKELGCGCSSSRKEDHIAKTIHPVDIGTGNKFWAEVDYSSDRPNGLQWVRYYNAQPNNFLPYLPDYITDTSNKTFYSPWSFGVQWHHGYERTIRKMSDSSLTLVVVMRPGGQTLRFAKSNGQWVIQDGLALDEHLTELTDSSGNTTGWVWTNVDDSEERYDAAGRLLSIQTKDGNLLRLTYVVSGASYPDSSQGGAACNATLVPMSDVLPGRLWCVTDFQGRQIHVRYGPYSISEIIDPAGNEIQYGYNGQWTYNIHNTGDGTLLAQSVSAVLYNGIPYRFYQYNSSSGLSAFSQTARTDLAKTTFLLTGIYENPDRKLQGFTWNTSTHTLSSDSSTSDRWTPFSSYKYNTDMKVVQEYLTSAIDSTYNTSQSTDNYTFTPSQGTAVLPSGRNYNPNFSSASSNNTRKPHTTVEGYTLSYDSQGNLSKIETPLSDAFYTYDSQNRLVDAKEDVSASGATDSSSKHRQITWDSTLRVPIKIVEDIPFYTSDGTLISQGQRETDLTWNSLRQLTQKTVSSMNGSTVVNARTWHYEYAGVLNQLSKITAPVSTETRTFTYYDADGTNWKKGDLKSVSDALGYTTTFDAYNANGRLLQTTDPNGVASQFTYDVRSNILTYTRAGRITSFTYDGRDLLTTITLPDNRTLTYTYDPAHRLTQIQDSIGNLLRYGYDSASNIVAMDRVDIQGNITWRREWKYDDLGQVIQERLVRGSAPVISMDIRHLSVFAHNDIQPDAYNLNPGAISTLVNQPFSMDRVTITLALLKGERV